MQGQAHLSGSWTSGCGAQRASQPHDVGTTFRSGQKQGRDTPVEDSIRKQPQGTAGFRYDERVGELQPCQGLWRNTHTQRKRQKMQIRKTDYTSCWHGKEGKESRGEEEKGAWTRRQPPSEPAVGGRKAAAKAGARVGEAPVPDSSESRKESEGVVSGTVSTKNSRVAVSTPSASECDLI